ncbi:Piso0_001455 [Millerozyma farinosa CBS 7064]|uniref:Piso0_001455 protein n=1 Tax=Pichia sorbitophila (strain ATCC MYA-4447 / BCRC 22081 / CBS 7064 / NBRC 10061 / NRRL Y-12695) TaxID=559304 RepID=G8YKU4_PICSO|nr:Piso0_001455 [Millerozyma farinosa CBS 7064]
MSTNFQSRSASVSNTAGVVSGPLFTKPSSESTSGLRSASIGPIDFKDGSTIFRSNSIGEQTIQDTKHKVNAGDTTLGMSGNQAGPGLDIVGALGNLDLDEDFDIPSKTNAGSIESESSKEIFVDKNGKRTPMSNSSLAEKASSNTPISASSGHSQSQSQFFHGAVNASGMLYDSGRHMSQSMYGAQGYNGANGSLTPNTTMGGLGKNNVNINTPSSPWVNAYVPSSAPPLVYNGPIPHIKDLPLSMKPFELPEDTTPTDTTSRNDGRNMPNLNLPFSSPPHVPFERFGGLLNGSQASLMGNQFPVGVNNYNFSDPSRPMEKSSPDSDFDSSFVNENGGKNVTDKPLPPTASPMGVPHGNHLQDLSNVIGGLDGPLAKNDLNGSSYFPMGGDVNGFPKYPLNPIGNGFQHAPSVWGAPKNGYNPVRSGQALHGNKRVSSGPVDGTYHGMGINTNRNNHGRRFHSSSESANVHRKSHNKRKGDDAMKYANAKLEDFTGEILSLCKDQHGCRFLQRQLDLGRELSENPTGELSKANILPNDVAASMIFNEIYLKIVELMTDPFGNYLIQKLFENVSTDQRIILVKNSSPEFIKIALDTHGTRALQKLVECITTEEEGRIIIESLSPHIVSLSRDLNGNHVVQKCLQKLKPSENQFIFDTASMYCNEIATHRHGCCVLQRCLDHGNAEQRKQLSLRVAENATNLSLDPFGNYVVQYVLSRGDEHSIGLIMDHIKNNIITLSLHKFGSNVIEKSLRIGKLTDELIKVLLENQNRFPELLNDAFGNYVLQTSLDVASFNDMHLLSQALAPLLPPIKSTPHGRRIMMKIQKA